MKAAALYDGQAIGIIHPHSEIKARPPRPLCLSMRFSCGTGCRYCDSHSVCEWAAPFSPDG